MWESSGTSEVTLGLAHGSSSKKEGVGAYYNYKLELEREKSIKTRFGRSNVPDGDFMISSSIVWQDPPAFTILARADSVKRRAATDNFGIVSSLWSSVTVPTTTAVLSLLPNKHAISKFKVKRNYLLLRSKMFDQFAKGYWRSVSS